MACDCHDCFIKGTGSCCSQRGLDPMKLYRDIS